MRERRHRAEQDLGRQLFLLAALVLMQLSALASPAWAGAWVPAPGSGYAKLWAKWLYGFGYLDGEGRSNEYGDYHELFLATYGELGVCSGLALTWHMDLLRSAVLQDPRTGQSQAHATLGDPRLGVRFQVLREGPFAIAGEMGLRAPLARANDLQPFVYADGTPAGQLRLGAGVWEADARLSAGVGLRAFYAQLGVGYLLRSRKHDDVLQLQLEGGTRFTPELAGRLRLVAHLPVNEGGAPYRENPAGVGNGVAYTGFALEADYELLTAYYLGLSLEGGLGAIRRQTGGPVVSLYFAHGF